MSTTGYTEFVGDKLHEVVHEFDDWLVQGVVGIDNARPSNLNSQLVMDVLIYLDSESGWIIGVYHLVEDT